MLTWLLSAAVSHDTAHGREVLSHARARDELLIATFELRERALALHLHIPHRFTLNRPPAYLKRQSAWAAVMARVEKVHSCTALACMCLCPRCLIIKLDVLACCVVYRVDLIHMHEGYPGNDGCIHSSTCMCITLNLG